MKFLIKHIRPSVYAVTLTIGVFIYVYIVLNVTSTRLQIIRLTQMYALVSLTLLYLTLLASPLYSVFPHLPLKVLYKKARKALGVSAFFFGLTHAFTAFYGQLGGWAGLGYLKSSYLTAIALSFTALCILFILALTSLNYFIYKLGKKWKPLHRLVYVAGVLIVIHALMLGSQFSDLSKPIPQVFFYALIFLLILQAFRINIFLQKKIHFVPRYAVFLILLGGIGLLGYTLVFNSIEGRQFLNLHVGHSSMKGEKAAKGRFRIDMTTMNNLKPNIDIPLTIEIIDTQTNQPVQTFTPNYEKILHLIIVDNSLTFFDHIHPQKQGSQFTITTKFLHSDTYHLYFNYQPKGLQEQQSSTKLTVGNNVPSKPQNSVDVNLTKTFGPYEVTLSSNGPLSAEKMISGKQVMTFTVKDAKTKQDITDLSPYIGAFGHLVMINEQTYQYIHVHPLRSIPPQSDEVSGPDVTFVPLPLNTNIVPGVYRIFAQFNHKGNIFVADYTVKVD